MSERRGSKLQQQANNMRTLLFFFSNIDITTYDIELPAIACQPTNLKHCVFLQTHWSEHTGDQHGRRSLRTGGSMWWVHAHTDDVMFSYALNVESYVYQ